MTAKSSGGNSVLTGGAIVAAVLAAVVGVMFAGSQQSERNRASNIDELPAIRQQLNTNTGNLGLLRQDVSSLRDVISEIQRVQGQQLDRDALNDAFQSLRDALEALEGQLNRRIQLEVKEPMRVEIDNLKELISGVDDDAEANEEKLERLNASVARLDAMVEALGGPE